MPMPQGFLRLIRDAKSGFSQRLTGSFATHAGKIVRTSYSTYGFLAHPKALNSLCFLPFANRACDRTHAQNPQKSQAERAFLALLSASVAVRCSH
jgi:hypothetical protein